MPQVNTILRLSFAKKFIPNSRMQLCDLLLQTSYGLKYCTIEHCHYIGNIGFFWYFLITAICQRRISALLTQIYSGVNGNKFGLFFSQKAASPSFTSTSLSKTFFTFEYFCPPLARHNKSEVNSRANYV